MDNEAPVFSIKNAHLRFGEHPLFSGVDLFLPKGKKFCLVGRNGSGKSTLLKVIAGKIQADQAEIFLQPGTVVSYMEQEDNLNDFHTLYDFIVSGLEKHQTDFSYKADILIDLLEINAFCDPKTASGGEKKKAALARALINSPDILLLDEPTNHLDISSIEKLEEIIAKFTGALIVISHDRAFLKRVCNGILWLDRGIVRTLDKGFDAFEDWRDNIYAQEDAEAKRLNKKITSETEWLHKGISARRKRNQGRLHKLYELRNQRREQIKKIESVEFGIDRGSVQSQLIIEAKNISKSFNEKNIIQDFSLRLIKGNKIGIIGKNGTGKTTLIKLLTGRLTPDTGSIRISKTLQEIYFDQNRATLDPSKTIKETLCPKGSDYVFVQGQSRHIYSYLKDFLFSPSQADTPVRILSGGEKNRLILARDFAKPSNFLVMDEPTNDLDIETLDLLQDALESYKGTVLIVSHDRDFLDKTATSLLYLSGNGSVIEYVDSCSNVLKKIKEQRQIKEKKEKNKTSQEGKSCKKKPSSGSGRLSYTAKRRFEQLPEKIELLENEIKKLEEKLSDPDFYNRSPEEYQRVAMELSREKEELGRLEEEWLDLSYIG